MTYEELETKLRSDIEEYGDLELDDECGIIEVDCGDWISSGKYEHQESVYADKERTVYAAVSYSRSGSYYSDYEYSFDGITQVKPVKRTITTYVAV